MRETKTVNIDLDLFKKIKIYCAINDIKIRNFVSAALKNKLKNDNIENSKSENN